MTLDKAIKLLEEEYERAKGLAYVRNPLACALYQVWKKADENTPSQCESEHNGRCWGQPETPPCTPYAGYCPLLKYKKGKES